MGRLQGQQVSESADMLMQEGFNSQNIGAVLYSPLLRTKETAQVLVAKGLIQESVLQEESRLIEVQMGSREGMPYQNFRQRSFDHSDAQAWDGETDEDVRGRIIGLCREIGERFQHGHIMLITHGSPAMELSKTYSPMRVPLSTGGTCIIPDH